MVTNYNYNRSSRQNFLRLMVVLLALFVITLASDEKIPAQRQTQMRSCRSISEIICETTAFDSFCEVLEETGLEDLLSTPDEFWTVFVPTNSALEEFGIHEHLMTSYNSKRNQTDHGDEELVDFLLFHTIQDRLVRGTDLTQCGQTFIMGSGQEATIECGENGGRSTYLSGRGNTVGMLPQVVITDVVACNGLIHVINGVLKDDPIPQLVPTMVYSGEEHDQKPVEIDIDHPDEDCQSIRK